MPTKKKKEAVEIIDEKPKKSTKTAVEKVEKSPDIKTKSQSKTATKEKTKDTAKQVAAAVPNKPKKAEKKENLKVEKLSKSETVEKKVKTSPAKLAKAKVEVNSKKELETKEIAKSKDTKKETVKESEIKKQAKSKQKVEKEIPVEKAPTVEKPKAKKTAKGKEIVPEQTTAEIKQDAKPKIIKDDALLEPIKFDEETPKKTRQPRKKSAEKKEEVKAIEPKAAETIPVKKELPKKHLAKPKIEQKVQAAPPKPVPAATKMPEKTTDQAEKNKPNVRYSDEDLEMFKTIILEARSEALDELRMLYERLEDLTNYDFAEESMIYSMHMAEQGSEAMEKEKTYAQIQRIKDYIKKLDDALERIKDKTYGICRVCGILIAKERLLAVPITTLSASYKIHQKCPEDGIDRIEPIKQ